MSRKQSGKEMEEEDREGERKEERKGESSEEKRASLTGLSGH